MLDWNIQVFILFRFLLFGVGVGYSVWWKGSSFRVVWYLWCRYKVGSFSCP